VLGARLKRKATSLLRPISVDAPDKFLHPRAHNNYQAPSFSEVEGARHTNKFWGSWNSAIDSGTTFSIFPAPWQLRWGRASNSPAGKLCISNQERDIQGAGLIISHFFEDFAIGMKETLSGNHFVTKEQHFGVYVEVRGPSGRSVTYPIYAGMAYVSALYKGGCTPRIFIGRGGARSVTRVRNGVWDIVNNGGARFRVYALTNTGRFVDGSYNLRNNGVMNKKLNGWVRLAHVVEPGDTASLDEHAGAILTGWDFDVTEGVVQYNFQTLDANRVKLLHFAYANHMALLSTESGNAQPDTSMALIDAPVKGKMTPLIGDTWRMTADVRPALDLDFLPKIEPALKYKQTLISELDWYLNKFSDKLYWRQNLFRNDHYFSGKGFQKLGYVCLLSEKYYGKNHPKTQKCAETLASGFSCMYKRKSNKPSWIPGNWDVPWDDWRNEGCMWAPPGTIYDIDWKGIPSRLGNGGVCGWDFGNSCYNDHHYHFGYFVASAAILVKLKPEFKSDSKFVDFINMFIRDTANPSKQDQYFPQFRAFDWFDMHSWSRGLKPDPMGKDQESTSEEVNLHWGTMMWGRMIGNIPMMKLGATMLTFASVSLREYFLPKRDSKNYPLFFAKNHVTGIFFQGKVYIGTWFGPKREYINGIQMLPLTPAVYLSRDQEFAVEEWQDQLAATIPNMDPRDERWKSLLYTGNLAFHQPKMAFQALNSTSHADFDDGLTKLWALYWTVTVCTEGCDLPMKPAPTDPPTQAPGGPPGGGPPAGGDIFCNPNLGQMCPGGIPCPQSGKCPKEGETPDPTQPPNQGGSGIFCNPDANQFCPGNVPCPQCGAGACECP